MAEILKLPTEAAKLGFQKIRKRCKRADDSNQLHLFEGGSPSTHTAEILEFASALSPFEQALFSDDRGDNHAGELYARAIEQEDCVADALCNLGILESERGKTVKAFDCFTKCLQHDPRHVEAHYNLANLYFEQNDFRLAQFHFEIAIEIDPEFANAYFNLALVQEINANDGAALQTLGKYKRLVSPEEAMTAEQALNDLKRSTAALKKRATSA
jgi:tetratricopeptide (TPR) repeat protein